MMDNKYQVLIFQSIIEEVVSQKTKSQILEEEVAVSISEDNLEVDLTAAEVIRKTLSREIKET